MNSLYYWVWKANDETQRGRICPFMLGPKSVDASSPADAVRKAAEGGLSGRLAVLNPFTCEMSFFDVAVSMTVAEAT